METVPSSWSPALPAFLGWTLLRTAAAEFMAFALFYAGFLFLPASAMALYLPRARD